jgi:hypothetical protein
VLHSPPAEPPALKDHIPPIHPCPSAAAARPPLPSPIAHHSPYERPGRLKAGSNPPAPAAPRGTASRPLPRVRRRMNHGQTVQAKEQRGTRSPVSARRRRVRAPVEPRHGGTARGRGGNLPELVLILVQALGKSRQLLGASLIRLLNNLRPCTWSQRVPRCEVPIRTRMHPQRVPLCKLSCQRHISPNGTGIEVRPRPPNECSTDGGVNNNQRRHPGRASSRRHGNPPGRGGIAHRASFGGATQGG